MSLTTKVCPVVLRPNGKSPEVLAFEHPLAGHQLIKGTIESDESAEQAAIREFAEESGINDAEVLSHLGTWRYNENSPFWIFVLLQGPHELPETWSHFCTDDGGHIFRFFWHKISEPTPATSWHPIFSEALTFIQQAIRKLPVE